jgi:hypothetical protein
MVWMIVATLAGCAQVPRQTKLMSQVPGVTMSSVELRERVLELGRRQVALIEEGVGSAYEQTKVPLARRTVMNWGLAAIPDVQEASLNRDPLVALADLWALSLQTQAFAAEGRGAQYLGEARPFVERTAREMARESEKVAEQVFGKQDVPRRREQVRRWAQANPITAATFARPTASAVLARQMAGEQRGAMQFIATTEDQLAQLDARMEMMNKTMLGRIRWTSQVLMQDALGADNVSALTRDMQGFVDHMRQKTIDDMDRMRVEVFAQVAQERAQIFRQVARERTTITAEADRLLAQGTADASRLVNRGLWRLGIGAAVLILLAAIAAWVVWHAFRGPRGRVSSRPWPRPVHG